MNTNQLAEALDLFEFSDALGDGDFSVLWEAANALRRLQAENEALRADAERYRWLRDPKRLNEGADVGDLYVGVESDERWGLAGPDADAAIDAAMKESK